MFSLTAFLLGGLGAMTRYFLDVKMSPRLRTERSIISPVFVINLVGSFLYGLLIMPVANPNALDIHYGASGSVIFWCTAITTGLLGGFTTFSTAMVEALTARREGKRAKFLMLWLVQVIGAVLAALAGYALLRPAAGGRRSPHHPHRYFLLTRLGRGLQGASVWGAAQVRGAFGACEAPVL